MFKGTGNSIKGIKGESISFEMIPIGRKILEGIKPNNERKIRHSICCSKLRSHRGG